MPWGEHLPTLRSRRLSLRHLSLSDAPALFRVFSDAEVIRYWSRPAMADQAEAEAQIRSIHQHFAARTLFQWGIELAPSAGIIGTCTLFQLDLANGRAELGIALGSRQWGHGYGREALRTLIAFAFQELHLHRLEADVDPDNARSLALFEGEGFLREGLLRERWFLHGRRMDTVLLGLLARDWIADSARGLA